MQISLGDGEARENLCVRINARRSAPIAYQSAL